MSFATMKAIGFIDTCGEGSRGDTPRAPRGIGASFNATALASRLWADLLPDYLINLHMSHVARSNNKLSIF